MLPLVVLQEKNCYRTGKSSRLLLQIAVNYKYCKIYFRQAGAYLSVNSIKTSYDRPMAPTKYLALLLASVASMIGVNAVSSAISSDQPLPSDSSPAVFVTTVFSTVFTTAVRETLNLSGAHVNTSVATSYTTIVTGTPWPTDAFTVQTSVMVNSTVVVPVPSTTILVPDGNTTETLSTTVEPSSNSSGVVTSTIVSTVKATKTGVTVSSTSGSATAPPSPQNAASKMCQTGLMGLMVLAGILGA